MPTAFTMQSPTAAGPLPTGVTSVGGIVLDLVGLNGRRVVSQLSADTLFKGTFNSSPGTIGTQAGFSPALLGRLGGGLSEAAIRVTLFDGDTAPGNFDYQDNLLLVNGVSFGNFSDVVTEETNGTGTVDLSDNPAGGFRNDKLDTGFFHLTDTASLDTLFASLAGGTAKLQLADTDPGDNFFDLDRKSVV